MKILANDGLSGSCVKLLESKGFEVITTKVLQEQLINYINEKDITMLLVRSATKVRRDIIDSCSNLKVIGRGGVGMDNIDVSYAKEKGIQVINTPTASSESVAELVFAHLFSGVRFLYDSNRQMPLEGDSKFGTLKKAYSSGRELRGKTLGLIGLGRIGVATAKIAFGVGMKVIGYDKFIKDTSVKLNFYANQSLTFDIKSLAIEDVLKQSDFISLHVPAQEGGYVIGKKELALIKKGSAVVNTSRGGLVDEIALVDTLDKGHLAFAALDVFESEPSPNLKVLMHPKISLTPHIGAATCEAQERIGLELANQIINIFNK